jgi:hypothetical protein
MDELASKILKHAGKSMPMDEEESDDHESMMDSHYGSMASELIDAIHSKDPESVKKILRMCSGA